MAGTYLIGFPVQREILLVAAQPRLGVGRPAQIDAVGRSLVTAIDNGDGSALFTEIHFAVTPFDIEITVNK